MRLPAGLRNNLGLKLLSLALALLLWSFVHGAKVIEREQRIPIHYVNLPDSLMLLETPPPEMRVLVSGPAQEMILHVNVMGSVAAKVDLSAATPSLDRVVPSLAEIDPPASERIAVERILSPSVITLRLARRVEREFPVRLAWNHGPASGYCLADSPQVEPSRVLCVGPEPILAGLQAIPTQPLELPARRGPATQEVSLARAAAQVECVPERVRVSWVAERRRLRTLSQVPFTVVPPARAGWNVELEATQAVLTLGGPETRLEALAVADIGLFLDASRLTPGHHANVPVIPQLPPWIELVAVEPRTVSLTVRGGTGASRAAAAAARRRAGTDLP